MSPSIPAIFAAWVRIAASSVLSAWTSAVRLPEKTHVAKQEPYVVDLQDMPQLKNLPTQNEKEAKR